MIRVIRAVCSATMLAFFSTASGSRDLRWIDRARPVEEAETAATFAAAHAGDGIVGFGFGGDERVPPGKLARACAIAREAGLMIVPHAGESVGPESVRAALDLRPRRIAHGVRTAESPALLARLAGEGIACDVCPTSNLRLGVVSDLAAAGLIARTVDEGPPLAVSYALTDRGRALVPALEQISLWAQEHLVEDGA